MDESSAYLRNLLIALPCFVLIPTAFWVFGDNNGFPVSIPPFLVGALGWIVAYLLRTPFLFAIQRLARDGHQEPLAIALSGPAEEMVRVLLILFVLAMPSDAYDLGLGWASIEIFYAFAQGAATYALLRQSDQHEGRATIQSSGASRITEPAAPLWGIAERASATAGHIGFGLIVAFNPWLVFITAPMHSIVNFIVLRFTRRSFLTGEFAAAVLLFVIFFVGLALFP